MRVYHNLLLVWYDATGTRKFVWGYPMTVYVKTKIHEIRGIRFS